MPFKNMYFNTTLVTINQVNPKFFLMENVDFNTTLVTINQ